MSEKRFKIYQDSIRKFESNNIWGVKSETNSLEHYMTFKEAEKCCDLLNEQQATISALKEENDILKQKLRKNYIANKQYEEMKRLQKENEQLRQTIKSYEYQIKKGYADLTYEEMLEKECENDE